MSKIIRYKREGINVIGTEELKGKVEVYSLCEKCKRRNKDNVMKDCHAYQKLVQVATLFSVEIPVFSCPSFSGEVTEPEIEDPKSQQTEADSTEEE